MMMGWNEVLTFIVVFTGAACGTLLGKALLGTNYVDKNIYNDNIQMLENKINMLQSEIDLLTGYEQGKKKQNS